MKHCKKGLEPQELQDYRAQNPSATWDDFRNENRDAYRDVVETLITGQRGLCAYCENSLTERDKMVEHFHPKSDKYSDHNWGLDWNNMLATCKGGSYPYLPDGEAEGRYREPLKDNLSCDATKGNEILDDIIIHPINIPTFPCLFKFRSKNGEMIPDETGCVDAGIPLDKVETTIKKLGLNCVRLKRIRKTVITTLQQWLDAGEDEIEIMAVQLLPDNNGNLGKFFTTIRWYFGDEAEAFLKAHHFQG